MQHPISSTVKHLRPLAPRLYKHCSHPLCRWQQAHWSVQGLIGTLSAERWKTTEGISGLPSSGKTTSAANSAAMLWKRGPASISVQVRCFQFNIVWFKLLTNWLMLWRRCNIPLVFLQQGAPIKKIDRAIHSILNLMCNLRAHSSALLYFCWV